jgi:hypothetical protein
VSRPGWAKVFARDTIIFGVGVSILLKEAGLLPWWYPADPAGPSLALLALGALCCNVPGILQVIQWRSGMPSSSSPLPPSASALPSAPPSGGE